MWGGSTGALRAATVSQVLSGEDVSGCSLSESEIGT